MTESTQDPWTGDAVVLAYVHSDTLSSSWHESILELLGHDIANQGRVLRGGRIALRCGTGGLVEARNKVVRTFLAEGRGEWLFWIDTDMGFAPDTLDRLIEAADPVERPVVGALCFAQREITQDGMGGWMTRVTPTVFDWRRVPVYDDDGTISGGEHSRKLIGEHMGFSVRWDYTPDTVTRVAGTGSACILIHRSVFERIHDTYGVKRQQWYDRITNPTTGQIVSEDLSFCMRAGSLGVPLFVHTGVGTTHHKPVWVSEDLYWQERAVNPPPEQFETGERPVFVPVEEDT